MEKKWVTEEIKEYDIKKIELEQIEQIEDKKHPWVYE